MIHPNRVFGGDCLRILPQIAIQSIDLILCDLPYGVTRHPEDKVIKLDRLWREYRRILKDRGTIVLTAQFPFTLDVINANRAMFRYDLIWDKGLVSGFLNAKRTWWPCAANGFGRHVRVIELRNRGWWGWWRHYLVHRQGLLA